MHTHTSSTHTPSFMENNHEGRVAAARSTHCWVVKDSTGELEEVRTEQLVVESGCLVFSTRGLPVYSMAAGTWESVELCDD